MMPNGLEANSTMQMIETIDPASLGDGDSSGRCARMDDEEAFQDEEFFKKGRWISRQAGRVRAVRRAMDNLG